MVLGGDADSELSDKSAGGGRVEELDEDREVLLPSREGERNRVAVRVREGVPDCTARRDERLATGERADGDDDSDVAVVVCSTTQISCVIDPREREGLTTDTLELAVVDGSLALEELVDLGAERDLLESLDESLLDSVVAEVERLEVSCLPQRSEEGGVAVNVCEGCTTSVGVTQREEATYQACWRSRGERMWQEKKSRDGQKSMSSASSTDLDGEQIPKRARFDDAERSRVWQW